MVKTNRKGNQFMREIEPYVQAIWPRAQRKGRGFAGNDFTDTGDFGIEAKNHARMQLGTWMAQAETNTKAEHRRFPVVIHKRRRFSASRAYVTMPLEDFFAMLADLKGVELPADIDPVSDETDTPDWPDDLDE